MLFQLEDHAVAAPLVAVEGSKAHIGQQAAAVGTEVLIGLVQRIEAFALHLQLDDGLAKALACFHMAYSLGGKVLLPVQQHLFDDQPQAQKIFLFGFQFRQKKGYFFGSFVH